MCTGGQDKGCVIVTVIMMMAIALQVVGLATPYWYSYNVSGLSGHTGLFEVCMPLRGCTALALGEAEDWWKAVITMEIISVILQVLSFLKLIVFYFKNQMATGSRFPAYSSLLAGVFGIIGIIIFGAKQYDIAFDNGHLNWSYALEVVGAVLSLVAATILLVSRRLTSGYVSLNP